MDSDDWCEHFNAFFCAATGFAAPYAYQRQLAVDGELPDVLSVPTGVGKTAAVILAWLYRRRAHPDQHVRQSTPHRLIYCLPMRTLVEQTERAALDWINNLRKHSRWFHDEPVSVHVLMGGVEKTNWDEHPERDAILIGTQDMLLSRALNRGYGMSRYRWPIHFALLNNDCLWVLDETQLMGVGLTTSVQFQGLRDKLHAYRAVRSLWMSATLDEDRLSTVDHSEPANGWKKLELPRDDRESGAVQKLIEAIKPCVQASVALTPESGKSGGYGRDVAAEIMRAHRPGTLTLAVVNRVARAQYIFQMIEKLAGGQDVQPEVVLIHARFRPIERVAAQERVLDEKTVALDGPGRIVVATQAIEAGVDISATTLFTELAAWSSLVQRFGRCNRRGTCRTDGDAAAQVFWVDIDTVDVKKSKELALPYSASELDVAREHIAKLADVGPKSLEAVEHEEPREIVHTIRRKDLLELWDTTPDLAGNDLDVSRYIRDSNDTDVQIYWRAWESKDRGSDPPDPRDENGDLVFPAPERDELCSVSVGQARAFVKKLKDHSTWRWDPLDQHWQQVSWYDIRPGMVLLLHVDAGGYDTALGWTGDAKHKPEARPPAVEQQTAPEAMGSDALGNEPLPLTQHLRNVTYAAESLRKSFPGPLEGIPWEAIITAARWHDVGKAHEAFQNAMRDFEPVRKRDPEGTELWGKSGGKGIPNFRVAEDDGGEESREIKRPGFRHELASALAWLAQAEGTLNEDLVAFLIAAHHGKVRGSIRSFPSENRPFDPSVLFARGLWEGGRCGPYGTLTGYRPAGMGVRG